MSTVLGEPLSATTWKWSPLTWGVMALAALTLLAAFRSPLEVMVATWNQVEEYGYGWFVPPIVAFLVWQRADRLRALPLQGQWAGLAVVAAGLALALLGQVSAVRLIGQYGFVVAVFGLAVCAIGWRGTRVIAGPLAMLLFMVPLPQFLLREMSQSLQLLSSQLGVALIRAADISVFLEGNVIDLGTFKLQVVDACSGLRYLFPLMVLGALSAFFYLGPLWQRVLLVASTAPLTVVINSVRIGLIGITVEHWGREMAEGLLHDLEGGFMFLVCIFLLLGEMAVLARLRGRRLREVFGLDRPLAAAPAGARLPRRLPAPAAAAALLLAAFGAVALLAAPREQVHPARQAYAEFPLALDGGWRGRPDHLAPDVLAILALDDYLLADYTRPGEPPVNFYSAYYATQSGGGSSHSPRTCIPGGGWAMTALAEHAVALPAAAGAAAPLPPLRVNRALIQKGEQRQLVYYWFRQRGRSLTDEYAVKWYILSDGIARNRSDGALLRLVTPIAPGEDPARADRRLAEFLAQVQPLLPAFVPD